MYFPCPKLQSAHPILTICFLFTVAYGLLFSENNYPTAQNLELQILRFLESKVL